MTDTTDIERRRPGRPSNAELAARQERPTRAEEVTTRRRRREGLGAERNLKLHVPEDAKDPNFVYRWVNDRPGRVQQLTTMDDYEVVSSSALNGGDPDPGANTAEGTVMRRIGDKSIGEGAVLIRKPKEYYEADKREEAKVLDARDEALRKGPPASQEGLSGQEAYVPGGRNVIAGR